MGMRFSTSALCRAAGGPRGACGAVAAVQQNGPECAYVRLSAELRADHEVVLAAVQHDGDALQLPSADLQEDCAIVLAAVQIRHGDALYYALTTPLQR